MIHPVQSIIHLFVVVVFHVVAISFFIALADRVSSARMTVGQYFADIGGLVTFVVVLLKEFVAELVATILLPFGAIDIDRLSPPRGKSTRVPVLLVHGYLQNRSNFFALRHYLKRNGFTHLYSVNLGNPAASITDHVATLDAKLAEIARESGAREIDIVAHSMGGLVSLASARRAGASSPIRRIVTLGTPFAGTKLAAFGFGASARDMLPGSEFLTALAAQPAHGGLVSIYSDYDNLVVPFANAVSPLATKSILIPRNGHHSMLFSPAALKAVLDELTA